MYAHQCVIVYYEYVLNFMYSIIRYSILPAHGFHFWPRPNIASHPTNWIYSWLSVNFWTMHITNIYIYDQWPLYSIHIQTHTYTHTHTHVKLTQQFRYYFDIIRLTFWEILLMRTASTSWRQNVRKIINDFFLNLRWAFYVWANWTMWS